MAKATLRVLKNTIEAKNLIGVSFKIVDNTGEIGDFDYIVKPNLQELYFYHDEDNNNEGVAFTLTINPLNQAQDDRATILLGQYSDRAIIRYKGYEPRSSIEILNHRDLEDRDFETAIKKFEVAFHNVSDVKEMTIAKQKIRVLELTEEYEDVTLVATLVFGAEKDILRGLSTFINTPLTRQDVKKLTQLIETKALSATYLGFVYDSGNGAVEIVGVAQPSAFTVTSIHTEVLEDGTFQLTNVADFGRMLLEDKDSEVMLLESFGNYLLRFKNKRTGKHHLLVQIG